MATTIINPAPTNNTTTDSGMGFLIGVIALIVFGFIFFVYGFPLIRQGLNGLGKGGINVTLPKTVNVKVQQTK
ncbi:hypothetical protein A2957_00075 [Candidatus Roizmanbacteria bacterium RIFCSPLOWO2_01_FULL_38_11]|uniref:Uncharacterized protein n=1 Tax=Candidatus Roizmanbacteria bacterium RIFCSPLOWO2_01_FULL_38_11 TaxID=1802060 RepID=A0A1F7IMW7_9BACT|nr:MAG: hypothetical protein A2957_00075 [Candidatus Roizmanbacteria bacterium RIFCSPLOWO2_01_FULL_38_11]